MDTRLIESVEDPDDNKFLSCALEAKANYVVSGDSHLLSLKHFHTIQIVDAATFIVQWRGLQSGNAARSIEILPHSFSLHRILKKRITTLCSHRL
ncbi:MAG: putative toxin-antitoxin system toxin component, PIN family [Desulfofustis sp. PB-SRB1]|nr:putative toxin-antitoxin system toxin component, PIN family [Desulfofustis sp. PB-SRB1]